MIGETPRVPLLGARGFALLRCGIREPSVPCGGHPLLVFFCSHRHPGWSIRCIAVLNRSEFLRPGP